MRTIVPGKLTARVFTGFEPFIFPRAGRLVGLDVDILAGFAARVGLELVLDGCGDFDRIWLSPGTGESDLAAAGIARFVEREDPAVAWSTPYFEVQRSLLIHRDRTGELREITDFSGHAIAFVRGSTADLDTRARAPAGTRMVPIRNQREGLAMLAAGSIDALAMGSPSNAHNRDMHPEYRLIDVHDFSQPEGLRFPVAARNREMLDALDGYIVEARASGEISRCLTRWLPDGFF